MVTDLQESNPNSLKNFEGRQIPAQFDFNGHSIENDNATFFFHQRQIYFRRFALFDDQLRGNADRA